jgi:adenylosuccinate lyase
MLREEAYRIVQNHAMHAWETDGDFRAAVEGDPQILSFLSIKRIEAVFSLPHYLAHVDRIFARVFPKNQLSQ